MKREGYFENGRGTRTDGTLNQLYPLPADILDGRRKDGFTYPVAVYAHDEGASVTHGFTYPGRIPPLRGKLVIGVILRGSLLVAVVPSPNYASLGIISKISVPGSTQQHPSYTH